MAANLPLDGRWNLPNTLCLAPKHTGLELALRQPEKKIKDFGQSYRHSAYWLRLFLSNKAVHHVFAFRLNLLFIAAVSADPQTIGGILQQKYPNVFSGVGKLKDQEVQLHIYPKVKPVAKPMWRTLFSMRSKLEEKIKELMN